MLAERHARGAIAARNVHLQACGTPHFETKLLKERFGHWLRIAPDFVELSLGPYCFIAALRKNTLDAFLEKKLLCLATTAGEARCNILLLELVVLT